MKSRIIALLQQATQALSGQAISEELGISRVAVWKHVRQLQAAGCTIESTPKGYRLISEPDTPHAWLFGMRSEQIHYFAEVTSTMDKALELARGGCPAFTVVVADRQMNGRGRLLRQWRSEEGGLYFTLVLRPDLTPAVGPLLNLAVALDVVAVLGHVCGIEAHVKWPNDVLAADGKIAGILSQMEAEADRIAFINIGVGINLNNNPAAIDPPAVSAKQVLGAEVSRVAVLKDFMERFEGRMAGFSPSGIVEEWRRVNVTLGRRVTIQTTRETVQGQAIDVDDSGALIVLDAEGRRRTVVYGDCFHLP